MSSTTKINRNKEGSGFIASGFSRRLLMKSLRIWLQAHFAVCYKFCLYVVQMHTQEANLTVTVCGANVAF